MSFDTAIRVSALGKCFRIYNRPQDRLKQALYGLLSRLLPGSRLKAGVRDKAHHCARDFWALQHITFEVQKGETVGIIGRNGSGKSTLLQMICGTLSPTCGDIEVEGRVAALLELGSGFNPEYSGRENVYLNGQLLGLTRDQIGERFEDIAKFADIGDFIDQPVKTYSSGMYVRLAFAVIAHVDADILIIDEALAVGDAIFTQKCMRFLRKFMQTGTVLFVSHDIEAVKSLCSKAIWVEKGIVVQSGDTKSVCGKYLQAIYEFQSPQETTELREFGRGGGQQEVQRATVRRDPRLDLINRTPFRNDIKLFEFSPEADNFGNGAATIIAVEFHDQVGALSWIIGGERVVLRISARVNVDTYRPVIGFYIKDRLGQILFGDNTYLTYHDNPLVVSTSREVEALFEFNMPVLPKGDYSICVAIAEGSSDSHQPAHWYNDALIFRSEASPVTAGLVGVPMHLIELKERAGSPPSVLAPYSESGQNQDYA